MTELPQNLLSLKMVGNPMEQRAIQSKKISAYRKPFVLHLSLLEDLDKIEIVPAERMSYLGTLRRKVNIDEMIMQKIKSDQVRLQGFKLQ